MALGVAAQVSDGEPLIIAAQVSDSEPLTASRAIAPRTNEQSEMCSLTSPAISPYASLVSDTATRSLITDCNSLLAAKSTLLPDSTSTIFDNWGVSVDINQWEGVTVCPNSAGSVASQNCNGIPASQAPRVTKLGCQGCDLSGQLHADLGNLDKLRDLNLERANLTGTIPSELGNLTELETLSLRAYLGSQSPTPNRLTGGIPTSFGNLTNLKNLWLTGNPLTGSIPEELGDLDELETLYIDETMLSGSIPKALGNMEALVDFRAHNIRRVDADSGAVTHTGLSGSIPKELGSVSTLRVLRLDGNSLSGAIPKELGNLSNLTELRLGSNALTGEIPKELGNLTRLCWQK